MQHPESSGGERPARFAAEMDAIWTAALEAPGDSGLEIRRAAFAAAAAVARGDAPDLSQLSAELAVLVEKIARHAWKVTDRDVEQAKQAGSSEDAVFELTVAAAAGAGSARLERALEAFRAAGGVVPR